eukprot:CAMPEP_0172797948 /NCGR_PEP_ID=MMETSP1075-20121228/778_1 /TAXON_ID=2916 /ORGANISM="Ceratium fusus, Strain PA161109" /LENGTH=78 /DNA_ID=CAMNT_0013635287 /DNA_START=665 /DNA_END=901 /DNA_ORIENTATION=-
MSDILISSQWLVRPVLTRGSAVTCEYGISTASNHSSAKVFDVSGTSHPAILPLLSGDGNGLASMSWITSTSGSMSSIM